jgi:hypothetical protein
MLAAALQAAPVDVSHERIGEGRYLLRVTLPNSIDIAAAQRTLLPTAVRLCARLPHHLGRYRWTAVERADNAGGRVEPQSITIEQELHCGANPPPTVAIEPGIPDAGWRPGPADDAAVQAATESFFAAREAGRFDDAYRFYDRTMQATSSSAEFAQAASLLNAERGRRRGFRNVAVTWYDQPPNAPVPGAYAAVDFVGDYENVHLMCGYALWLLQPDRTWRMVTLVENNFLRNDTPNPTADDLARTRALFRCRE